MPRIEPIEMHDATDLNRAVGRRFPERKERRMSTYLPWAVATGAAGCGRCATAV